MRWIAFFSQTGSEIVNVAKETGFVPHRIVTNTQDLSKVHPGIFQFGSTVPIVFTSRKPTVTEYYDVLRDAYPGSLITLHGWLRIVPAEICNVWEILNGHPGLITKYPELKGFNKQEDIVDRAVQYPEIGSVIHKVAAEVDAGEILASKSILNDVKTIEESYAKLKLVSKDLWVEYFKGLKER
jgi:folate-dependent phosphoribosylglycinamide formyltransferase PurN